MFHHAGLRFNELPGRAGLSFTSSSDFFRRLYDAGRGLQLIFRPDLYPEDGTKFAGS